MIVQKANYLCEEVEFVDFDIQLMNENQFAKIGFQTSFNDLMPAVKNLNASNGAQLKPPRCMRSSHKSVARSLELVWVDFLLSLVAAFVAAWLTTCDVVVHLGATVRGHTTSAQGANRGAWSRPAIPRCEVTLCASASQRGESSLSADTSALADRPTPRWMSRQLTSVRPFDVT